MINLKKLRGALKDIWNDEGFLLPDKRIIIKRKKKMILEENSKGDIKTKRKNVIKIEIIE